MLPNIIKGTLLSYLVFFYIGYEMGKMFFSRLRLFFDNVNIVTIRKPHNKFVEINELS